MSGDDADGDRKQTLISCCASNLPNRDGHLARPTTNVLNSNEIVKCATAYLSAQWVLELG
jgi:hypothetical protein